MPLPFLPRTASQTAKITPIQGGSSMDGWRTYPEGMCTKKVQFSDLVGGGGGVPVGLFGTRPRGFTPEFINFSRRGGRWAKEDNGWRAQMKSTNQRA